LVVGQEAHLESSPCEDGDAEQGIGGFVYDGDSAEDGTEVGIMGTGEAASIAKDDVEGALPALWDEVELVHYSPVGD